jgi:hypothetical protein
MPINRWSNYTNTCNPQTVHPHELEAHQRFGYKVVAVVGSTGKDWAAYCAPTTWPDDEVATNGDKISEEAAKQLFPTLARTLTWRR